MIRDVIAADERMTTIGYADMKKQKPKHVFFMMCVVLIQVTAGFGLYQDARGHKNGYSERLSVGFTENKNA